ncbi:MAG TPA: N(4)-(beta-N-acetylglucosaminyl)-L-asparaginase [Fimbriimonadaceae bacterium]|nr:N(4)-(beta-N-acetylglucosaminyl)-L-asparaginase [Fimbriimonadaceae bacterium]HRJ96942.1 N(4)-(beta-N-acetylglucosaminyl)-L-asparaginase [Fimbriimonadaceae bacterium]
MKGLTRRDLLVGSAAALAPSTVLPTILVSTQAKPIVVASGNGHTVKNGGPRTCIEEAYRKIVGGDDVLESVVAGVNIVELDPADTSVGYGGLPNADGVVQLDSCVMHGTRRWAGGVAALEGVRTPSSVARLVAAGTDHHLLVGRGAQDFARQMGFTVEADLNSDRSRQLWLEWKRRIDPDHYLDPARRDGAALAMMREGLIDREHYWGTINCLGMNSKGEICGVTTTSGLAFKIPGRVGDSPILGAGLYVDNPVGAAGSTGRGEANLYNLCSFLVVEELRRGKHPKDAGFEALRRVAANTREKRLLDDRGRPAFGLSFYVLDAKGRYAGVNMSGRAMFSVCDENGPRRESCESLFP